MLAAYVLFSLNWHEIRKDFFLCIDLWIILHATPHAKIVLVVVGVSFREYEIYYVSVITSPTPYRPIFVHLKCCKIYNMDINAFYLYI